MRRAVLIDKSCNKVFLWKLSIVIRRHAHVLPPRPHKAHPVTFLSGPTLCVSSYISIWTHTICTHTMRIQLPFYLDPHNAYPVTFLSGPTQSVPTQCVSSYISIWTHTIGRPYSVTFLSGSTQSAPTQCVGLLSYISIWNHIMRTQLPSIWTGSRIGGIGIGRHIFYGLQSL